MKKRVLKIILILPAVIIALYAALQIYVRIEENKRADAPGNADEWNAENLAEQPASILNGKTLLFLGSSVTFGAAAEGQSFAELFASLDDVHMIKEAESGTTLADKTSVPALIAFGNGDSYVKRLKALDQNTAVDCAVIQLSTNDATLKLPLGDLSTSFQKEDFDAETVTGAMEYIIAYCKEVWNCPAVFYTGSYFESDAYLAMVKQLYKLQEKWHIGIIDLYTDKDFNNISRETYDFYMYDPIHPTKAGYVQWWYPRMRAELIRILEEN